MRDSERMYSWIKYLISKNSFSEFKASTSQRENQKQLTLKKYWSNYLE